MSDRRIDRLRARVSALSDAQRRALADRVTGLAAARGSERLVGFIVTGDAITPTDDALRAFLQERLPDYMVPARFLSLERLPRTAAGKLDRRALMHLSGDELTANAGGGGGAPRNEIETKLVAIWKEVLKLDAVGVNDDFFEIGGDSLLSIRVIARAGRVGLRIAPDRFFERPTIAHLAASVERAHRDGVAVQTVLPVPDAVGDAPLTPIQHWFLDAIPRERDWWNQSYLLELRHELSAAQLDAIARALVDHHDALRLRLVRRDGRWRQEFAPPSTPPDSNAVCRVVDLRSTPPVEYSRRVAEESEREHASLRLEEGRLFRCVVFVGEAGWRRVLLLGHHALLDSISWSVILEDFATLVTRTVGGQPLRLPDKTASARAWAIGLAERAAMPAAAEWAAHWLAMPGGDVSTADGDALDPSPGHTRDAEAMTITLGADQTRVLLQDVPRRTNASAQAVLLAALLLAWRDWSGQDTLRLDLEGHGRDTLGDTLDVSRTVGWFTTVFPVYLAIPSHIPSHEGQADDAMVEAVLKAVQYALEALPLRGAGHGLARYLAPDESTRRELAAQPRPQVLFNYLGTHDVVLPAAAGLRATDEPQGRPRNPDAPRAYPIEINTRVERGTLIVTVEYSRQARSAAAMGRFASALRTALDRIGDASSVAFGFPGVDASSLAIVADLLAEVDEA